MMVWINKAYISRGVMIENTGNVRGMILRRCHNPFCNSEGIGSFSPGLARSQRAYPGPPQFSSKTLKGLHINAF
jgi:hypothetical protein